MCVQHLNCRFKKCQTIASYLWPPNRPDLNPVYYTIWAVMQRRVYQRQIYSVDELKWQLIDVWCSLEQLIFSEAIHSGKEDLMCVSVLKEDTMSELTI